MFRSTHSRVRRRLISSVTLGLVAVTPIAGAATRAPVSHVSWQRFTSCNGLVAYLRAEALPSIGPYGLGSGGLVNFGGRRKSVAASRATESTAAPAVNGAPSPAVSAAVSAAPGVPPPFTGASDDTIRAAANAITPSGTSSSTNTQEANVDEGDIVENDGRLVYSVVDGRLRIVDTVANKELGGADLLPNSGEAQMLLDGPRLAVAQSLYTQVGPEAVVSLYDVSNPAAPALLTRTHLEGQLVALRSIDHRARVVLQTGFGQRLGFVTPTDGTDQSVVAAINENKRVVRRAPISAWLPRTYREDGTGATTPVRQALACGEIGRPAEFSGFAITWTATLDLNTDAKRVDAIGSAGVVGSGGVVYASGRRLYVSTQRYAFNGGPIPIPIAVGRPSGLLRPLRQLPATTVIHAFDLSPADGAAYLASGSVDGTLLNQFAMSEFNGDLRVATTSSDAGFGGTLESQVRVLRRAGRSLAEVATLGGLGRNERIYAVRFVGDIGFIVTFRQTDPLYVIDLRDPLTPRLAGQLKINGFSSYLQPIGDGQMLGIGQDATSTGQRLGTQISLFDVRDLNNPQQLATLPIGSQSEAESDHHAFLWWAPTRSVVVPSNQYPQAPNEQFRSDVVVATVGQNTITEKGRISHPQLIIRPPGPIIVPNGPPLPVPPNPVGQPPTSLVILAPTTASPATVSPSTLSLATPPPSTVSPSPQPGPIPTTIPGGFFSPSPIRRSLVVAGRLVTVSGSGVKVNDLGSLVELGWTPFAR